MKLNCTAVQNQILKVALAEDDDNQFYKKAVNVVIIQPRLPLFNDGQILFDFMKSTIRNFAQLILIGF